MGGQIVTGPKQQLPGKLKEHMQTAEETTQVGSVSRWLKLVVGLVSGWAKLALPQGLLGECGGIGWSWSGSNTLGPLCVCATSSQHTFHRVCPGTFPQDCFCLI